MVPRVQIHRPGFQRSRPRTLYRLQLHFLKIILKAHFIKSSPHVGRHGGWGGRPENVGFFHHTRESSTVAPLHCTMIPRDCILTDFSFDTCMLHSMLRSLTTPPNTDEVAANLRNLCKSSRTVASYPPAAISSRIAPSPHL